jgi:hypothetical protein
MCVSETYLHERNDNVLVEYRRVFRGDGILWLEGRTLRPSGWPYDEVWWHINDREQLYLSQNSDIVSILAAIKEPQNI